jgi:hypothetical protein
MRVHLKKVMQSAVEQGVVVGYHRIDKLPKNKRANTDVMVDTMLMSIWESLDGIIDFTDDGEETESQKKMIGFQADAVSMIPAISEDEAEADDDEDDDIVPLDTLYRVHRRK